MKHIILSAILLFSFVSILVINDFQDEMGLTFGITIEDDHTISFESKSNNSLLDKIPVPLSDGSSSIDSLTVNPLSNSIYLYGPGKLAVMNMDNENNVTDIINNLELPKSMFQPDPIAIAVDKDRAKTYIAENSSNMLYVLDANTNKLLNNFSLLDVDDPSIIEDIEVNSKTGMIYASKRSIDTDGTFGKILAINATTEKVIPVTINLLGLDDDYGSNVSSVGDLAINEKTNTIYSSLSLSNKIVVINGTTNKEIYPITVADNHDSVIVADNREDMIHASNEDINRIYVIDPRSNTIARTILGNMTSEETGREIHRNLESFNSSAVINPDTGLLYVLRHADTGSDKVFVIDTSTNRTKGEFVTNSYLQDIDINPVTNLIYILTMDGLYVLDGKSNEFIVGSSNFSDGSVETKENTPGLGIGHQPFKVETNPLTNKVYVIYKNSSEITIINGSNNRVIDSISVEGFPTDIDINSDRNKIYVTNPLHNSIVIIDGVTDKPSENISSIKNPVLSALNPLDNIIYVANGSEKIYSISGFSNELLLNTTVDVVPEEMEYDKNFKRLFASYSKGTDGNKTYSVMILEEYYDSRENLALNILENITIGNSFYPPKLTVNPNTNVLYVGHNGKFEESSIFLIDSYANRIMANMTLNGSLSFAQISDLITSSKDDLLYVVLNPSLDEYVGKIAVIDPKTKEMINNETLGLWPGGMAINSNSSSVYVTNTESDTLSIIDTESNRVIVGVNFKIIPPHSGNIICDGQIVSDKYERYTAGTNILCEAKGNAGFLFSSWNSNFKSVNDHSTNTIFDSLVSSFGNVSHDEAFDNKIDNNPKKIFILSDFGEIEADFVPVNTIPAEFWTPFYGLIPIIIGTIFIPSVINWTKQRRKQNGRFVRFDHKIGKSDPKITEEEITKSYEEEEISYKQYIRLKNKLADYHKDKTKG
jgi:YVTN family beta-propeller protein